MPPWRCTAARPGAADRVVSSTPEEAFDAVAEVWFDSEELAQGVFNTPERRAGVGDARFRPASVLFVAEEHVIVPEP